MLALVRTPAGATYKGVLLLKETFIDVNHIQYLWVFIFIDFYGSVLFWIFKFDVRAIAEPCISCYLECLELLESFLLDLY